MKTAGIALIVAGGLLYADRAAEMSRQAIAAGRVEEGLAAVTGAFSEALDTVDSWEGQVFLDATPAR